MPESRSFAIYDAFSDRPFGGSQAAVITETRAIDNAKRQQLAREIGLPATAFVNDVGDNWIEVQFMSTVMELPMCGHGTLCLVTHLLENGHLRPDDSGHLEVTLRLPSSSAKVSVSLTSTDRYQIMLDIKPPAFVPSPEDLPVLLETIGIDSTALDPDLIPEIANGDFVHLVVPLKGLTEMQAIKPDFSAIVDYCNRHKIETVVVICTEVVDNRNDIHVRDFCPAVGVSESAAAGTTNAAVSSYLLRHGRLATDHDSIRVNAEQGIEINRPSSIKTLFTLRAGEIDRLQVGGIATRVMDGQVYL